MHLSLYLSKETYQKLEDYCRKKGKRRNSVVAGAVTKFLESQVSEVISKGWSHSFLAHQKPEGAAMEKFLDSRKEFSRLDREGHRDIGAKGHRGLWRRDICWGPGW